MIEAVLFDYGMVLSGPANPAAWQRMLEITHATPDHFHRAYWAPRHDYDRGTHTGPEYWLATGEHLGVVFTPEQIKALIDADTALWTQLNPPMIEWAARLQAAGTRTAILSNLGDAMTAGVEAAMPWLSGFHHLTFSYRLKLAKPEVEIYRHAAEGLGVTADRVLFIDDRADNCEGGRQAGMQVIQYGDHAAFIAEMEFRGLGSLWRDGRSEDAGRL